MNAALCLFFIEVVHALSIALVRCHAARTVDPARTIVGELDTQTRN
jgi:hypothetical protein